MTLVDENEVYMEQEKKKKTVKLIIRAIIILVIIAILLMVIFYVKNMNKVTLYKDGEQVSTIPDGLILKSDNGGIIENNGKIYFSIQKLSTLLGKQYYNNEYKRKGEDATKCQVRNENIYTSFIANSNKMYKAVLPTGNDDSTSTTTSSSQVLNNNITSNSTTNGSSSTSNTTDSDGFESIDDISSEVEFEYFTLPDSIKEIDGVLYVDQESAKIGFDVDIEYNSKSKKIVINSLDTLESYAKNNRKDCVDSTEYSYLNKRLLKYGMTIIKDSDGNIGVGSFTNKEKLNSCVASCKYSSIEFDEATKTLTAISSQDNKKCILYLDLDNQEVTKTLAAQYDDIKAIDNNFNYFVVKQDNKYGIVNSNSKIILYPLYDELGIDDSLYPNVTNKYILNDKYVPVKQNGVWGLYNIDGTEIIKPQYEGIGCTLAQSGDPVVIIPNIQDDADGVVFLYKSSNGSYGVFNATTGEKIAVSLTEVFKDMDVENYYINYATDRDNAVVHTLNVYTDL